MVAALLDRGQRTALDARNRKEQESLRALHAGKQEKPLLPLEAARSRAPRFDWAKADPPVPAFLGARLLDDQPLSELVELIDWTFFFTAWEIRGRFPRLLDDPVAGAAARDLYDNGRRLLDEIVRKKLLRARGVYGFWPAQAEGDDIVLARAEDPSLELVRFPMLRQQASQDERSPYRSLADFVAPRGSGRPDFAGAFAVTAGIGADDLAARYERDHDDYRAIMVKALADRLAEAFAERLHRQARRDWGYGAAERLSNEDLIDEKYRGIRPAFGYPACPDHTQKGELFGILDAGRAGLTLTGSFAMFPAASVSGLYLSHPDARYFGVGRIGRDQAADYARRRGMPLPEVERWLAPNLGYDPAANRG